MTNNYCTFHVATQLQTDTQKPYDDWDVFEEFHKFEDVIEIAKDHPEYDMRKYNDTILAGSMTTDSFAPLIKTVETRLNDGKDLTLTKKTKKTLYFFNRSRIVAFHNTKN